MVSVPLAAVKYVPPAPMSGATSLHPTWTQACRSRMVHQMHATAGPNAMPTGGRFEADGHARGVPM